MSFQPSNKQELQNRKILEELQKKQQALKQPNASTSNLSIKPVTPKPQINQTNFNQIDPSINNFQLNNPQSHSNGHQSEKALQYALQISFGNYQSQDSSFGNLILPVLPYSF